MGDQQISHDPFDGGGAPRALREALRRVERDVPVPDSSSVLCLIAQRPSPLDAPRWSVARSLRTVAALAWAQIRIVPWLVVPVALAAATTAGLAARFLGLSHESSAAESGFASVMLVGVVVTVTMALSNVGPDSVALATALGPQTVVVARVFVVLLVDSVAGVIVSALVASWGVTDGFVTLVAGWMAPLALIAGAVTFVAIWVAPWAGIAAGVILTPFVGPASVSGPFFGWGIATLSSVLTPLGVAGVGAVVLVLSAASARQALLTKSVRV